MTTPDPYLMPRVNDMLIEIGNAKFLTKMDLNKGFHQIPLQEEDQCKTAFCTLWGKWQYTVMPFGLCNVSANFQQLMHIILADIHHSLIHTWMTLFILVTIGTSI